MTDFDVEAAIQNAFEGTLDEETCHELRQTLKSDPAARALYFQHASLHQLLIYRLSRIRPLETARSLAQARLRLQTRRTARLAFAAAAIFMIGLGLALRLFHVREQGALATVKGDSGSRYSVEQVATGQANAATNELQDGTHVDLTQGTLEITLRNGVRAVVLAPARFRLESEKCMKLHEGTAWFDVGKDGMGFQVISPGMSVTDLGTQFGVLARTDAADEVHVFSGQVTARGLAGLRTEETLTTGMARVSDPVGRLKTVRLRPEAFVTRLPEHTAQGLILNGDFESGNPPPSATYGTASTASLLPNWRFGRNITVVRTTSEGRPGYGEDNITILSSTGDTQIGFNAHTETAPDAEDSSLIQTFATEPGRRYRVRFEMGAIFFSDTPMEVTAAVFDGFAQNDPEALGSLAARRSPSDGNGYNPPAEFTFTARSGQSTLVITETSSRSFAADPVIDNVSVEAAD